VLHYPSGLHARLDLILIPLATIHSNWINIYIYIYIVVALVPDVITTKSLLKSLFMVSIPGFSRIITFPSFSLPYKIRTPRLFSTMASAPPSLKCPPLPATYKDEPTSAVYEQVPPYDAEDAMGSVVGNLEPIVPLAHISPPSAKSDKDSEADDSLYGLTPAGNRCLSCQKRSRLSRISQREKYIFGIVFSVIFMGFLLLLVMLIGRAIGMARCGWR
jgi:hypothetical protein